MLSLLFSRLSSWLVARSAFWVSRQQNPHNQGIKRQTRHMQLRGFPLGVSSGETINKGLIATPNSADNPARLNQPAPGVFNRDVRPLVLMSTTMVLFACGCARIDGQDYVGKQPGFDLKAYFTGPIKAWGIVQDRSGKVIQQFDIAMHGSWQGNKGTLVEDFSFYDGKQQQRIWHITDLGEGRFEGRADDILNTAQGLSFGNAGQWTYVMDVPVKDGSYRMHFDDWMWAMQDGVLINRSYMKKFGLTFAEITIFMQKQQ